jgi:Transposase IS116/IS110/IS902 family
VDGTGRAWLAGLELPATPRAIIQDCCGLLDALAIPIGRLEGEIAGLAKPDPRVQALMALPGIGKLTAMTLVAEIGDIGRFPTARKLRAWAGLTPQVRNSDRTVRHGHITKQGSPWVRWILQEAAQTAKRHPMFADTYGQLPTAVAPTSPPWPSPGGYWPAASTSSGSWRFHLNYRRRPGPGALASLHEPAPRPPVLTEQPGPDSTVMRTPPLGPEWVHASQLRDVVRGLHRPTIPPSRPTPQASQPKAPLAGPSLHAP